MNKPKLRTARTNKPLLTTEGIYELEVVSVNRTKSSVKQSDQVTFKYRDVASELEFLDYIQLSVYKVDAEGNYILDGNNCQERDDVQSRQMVERKLESLIGSIMGIPAGDDFMMFYDDDEGLLPTQSCKSDEGFCLDDLVNHKFVGIIRMKEGRLRIVKSYSLEDGIELVKETL